MPSSLNAHCFEQPHWRIAAQGFETDAWFEKDEARGTGGIFNPQRIHLRTGNFYYRFASSTKPVESQVGGPWWLDFESYKQVESFARSNDCPLSEAARLILAISHEFSRVDRLVRALLIKELDAYSGEGKPAQGAANTRDRGTRWIPTQHVKVRQLFVPGLYVRPGSSSRPRTQLYQVVFQQPVQVTSIW